MLNKKSYLSGCNPQDIICKKIAERFVKNENGNWKKTEVEEEMISAEHYCNMVDAVPFFRNLGGKEIVSKGYTYYGYIPIQITSISPARDAKVVYHFSFVLS